MMSQRGKHQKVCRQHDELHLCLKSNIYFILTENVITTSKAKPTTSKAKNKKKNTPILEEEVTDGAATDGNEWIKCKNKKSHHINIYGNPTHLRCVHNTERDFLTVKQTGGQGEYFKFFDAYQYFEGPPNLKLVVMRGAICHVKFL